MSRHNIEVPYGTLELLILKTLESMGAMHGYSIARRIAQISERTMRLSQGSIYPALMRLEQQGLVTTEWGVARWHRAAAGEVQATAAQRNLKAPVNPCLPNT